MYHGDQGLMPGMTPGSSTMVGMMMQMNFYWGHDAIILFSGWPGHRLGMYILALLFVFLLAVAVEFLSVLPNVKPGSSPVVGVLKQAVVYTLRMGLAYLVMLSVMSFNFGIFIVVVVGHGIGFFMVKTRAIAAKNQTASPTAPDTIKI